MPVILINNAASIEVDISAALKYTINKGAFDVVENSFTAITTDWYLAAAAVIGNKAWIQNLSSEAVVKWLYVLQSGSANLRRIMIF